MGTTKQFSTNQTKQYLKTTLDLEFEWTKQRRIVKTMAEIDEEDTPLSLQQLRCSKLVHPSRAHHCI